MRNRLFGAALVLAVLGCGGSDDPGERGETTPPRETPDASIDTQVAIAAPSKLRLIQGSPARVLVNVTLTGAPAPVELSLSGLPAGVASPTVTAAAGQAEVELVIEASSASVQGTRADAVITAKTGERTTTAVLGLHVTGAPGTPDRSFGTSGVVSVQPPGLEQTSNVRVGALAVQESGHAVVLYNYATITKLDAKGALDTTFGAAGPVSGIGCPRQPCLFIQPDSKILLLNQDGAASRLWDDGRVDLSFGDAGALQWSSNDRSHWAAAPSFVDGQLHLLRAGSRGAGNKPFVERVAADGAHDPRFDATAALACTLPRCLWPLALGARADGSVLYASYPGAIGNGTSDVQLTELSSTGAARYTTPVLFAASGNYYLHTRIFLLPDVGDATLVYGLDHERKLTVAKVSATGATEVVRTLGIERASFPECDNFGIFPTGADRLTVYCTVDETREVRLLRLTHALAPDESFGPGGLVVGNSNGTGAHVAVGPDDTLLVAAEKKLTRIWN